MTYIRVKLFSKPVKALVIWLIASCLLLVGCGRVEDDIQALKNEDWNVRRDAAARLSEARDARAVEPLIVALRDAHPSVRGRAAVALGKIKDTRAVEPLVAALKDSDKDVRAMAAEALGEIKDVRAVEPLIAALKDESSYASVTMTNALVGLGIPAVKRLITLLKDKDVKVQILAAEVLGKTKDARAVEPLIASLKNNDPKVKARAAIALGEIRDSRAVAPLIAALKDEAEVVRRGAASALGEIKDTRAVEPLIAALNRAILNVKQAEAKHFLVGTLGADLMAMALGEIKDIRAVEPLVAALKSEIPDVQDAATLALERIGSPAVESLIAASNDENWGVRRRAAKALGEIKDARATEFLTAAFRNENLELVAGAYRFFVRRGESGTEDVLVKALIRHGDKDMAEYFLNCGNSKLEQAAIDWASRHDYNLIVSPYGGGETKWGAASNK